MRKQKYFKYLLCSSIMCLLISSAKAAPSKDTGDTKNLPESGKTAPIKNDSYEILKEKGFYLEKNDNLTLDLFEKENLDIALKEGLEFILSNKTSIFIDDKSSLNESIVKNPLLKECIESTINYIKSSNDSQDTKRFNLLKRLTSIKKLIEIESSIPKNNLFYKFISSVKDAYQVLISRKVASDVLKDNREKVESTMGSQSTSQSGGVNTGTTTGGVNIGVSVNVSNNEGSGEKAFYKIDNSGNIKISVGTGFSKYLSASVGYNLGTTRTLIFYSLEQFLDSYAKDGKISSVELREPDIKKIAKSRDDMKKAEKQLLSNMQNSISSYLKISNIVPQNVNLKLPDITSSAYADSQSSTSSACTLNVEASCLASIGMEVKIESQTINTSIKHSYIKLIKKDCSPSKYAESSAEISKFLKQEKTKKYTETEEILKSYFENETNNKETNEKALSILVSNMIGDLKQYNSSLYILSDDSLHKQDKLYARNLKEKIELGWLGKIANLKRGRLEILKTAIATAAKLRDYCKSEATLKLFNVLYGEIENLSKMQTFSKNLFKRNPNFKTTHTSDVNSVSGQAYFDIPIVGTTSFNIDYTESESEAKFDNSEDITVKLRIPMRGDKLLGENSIKNKFKELIEKLSKNKNNYLSDSCGEALGVVEKDFSNILEKLGVETTISIPTVLSTKKYLFLNIYLTKVDKNSEGNNVKALPGNTEPIIKNKDKWVIKNIKRTDSSITNLKVGIDKYAKINLSNNTGTSFSKIGADTLTFIINKYNGLTSGFSETTDETNPMWEKFTNSQKERLKTLFENINNTKSNARYELQTLFNDTLENENKTKTEHIFTNFLDSCSYYSIQNTEKNYEKALDNLNKVLNLNYTANYLTELDRLHTINNL
ncbi:MAG: hypothetical protein IJI84_06220 [Clostridia bacterium]|nr:hypothetical protein [Clostridia bacterium]